MPKQAPSATRMPAPAPGPHAVPVDHGRGSPTIVARSARTCPAWLVAVITLLPTCPARAMGPPSRAFSVRDFGARPDGETESGGAIRETIRAAIASGTDAEVVLEAGTYRVKPPAPREPCFEITGANGLTVRGAGADTRIVVTDPAASAFHVGPGRLVTLRDIRIDYDPVPFCQGTIREVDPAAGSFDLEVDAGYPTPDAENFARAVEPYGKWGMILDRATRRIRDGTPDHFMTPRWRHLEGRLWRFFTADEHHRRNLMHMKVGDAYVHLARGHGSGVLAQGCEGVRIENVTIHAAPGLAVGLVGNRGEVLVRGLEVRFAPGTTRLLSTNADGVHCQQNRTGPVIEDCYFEGMADDAINVYAPPNVLLEKRTATQWLVSPGCLVLANDRLQVFDPGTGRIRGQVRATGVKLDGQAWLLTLDQPLESATAGADHRTADTLYNLDACGAGFQIRRNHMNGNRRYGCLLRAGDGVVEDNLFEDTTGAGVVLTNEPDWPEGPVPWGVRLRRNRFVRGGTCLGYAEQPQGAAVVVLAARLGHGPAEAEGIDDVVIEQNTFMDRAGPAIYVGASHNVTLRDNQITAAPGIPSRRTGGAIVIERGGGVAILDTTIRDPRPETTSGVEIQASARPGATGVQDHEPANGAFPRREARGRPPPPAERGNHPAMNNDTFSKFPNSRTYNTSTVSYITFFYLGPNHARSIKATSRGVGSWPRAVPRWPLGPRRGARRWAASFATSSRPTSSSGTRSTASWTPRRGYGRSSIRSWVTSSVTPSCGTAWTVARPSRGTTRPASANRSTSPTSPVASTPMEIASRRATR